MTKVRAGKRGADRSLKTRCIMCAYDMRSMHKQGKYGIIDGAIACLKCMDKYGPKQPKPKPKPKIETIAPEPRHKYDADRGCYEDENRCLYCDKPFEKIDAKYGVKKYCNLLCKQRMKDKRKRIKLKALRIEEAVS